MRSLVWALIQYGRGPSADTQRDDRSKTRGDDGRPQVEEARDWGAVSLYRKPLGLGGVVTAAPMD